MVTLLPAAAWAQQDSNTPISLTLDDTFIETFKNRATIRDIDFFVDKAHDRANPASKDGDLHVAGRSDQIGLPMVAELMNAKREPGLVQLFNDREGSTEAVKLTGVWRIWPEHGGLSAQKQGDPVQPATTTNPEHLFEVHPITEVNGDPVVDTLRNISGFEFKDANDAFQRYESAPFALECQGPTTTLRTKMIGFNYVDFQIELLEAPSHFVEDGLSVFANVLEPGEGELIVHKRRVWFVKGSLPFDKVRTLSQGARLRIAGLPRINLSLVSFRCQQAATQPDVLTWNLPYEMVAVGLK